MAQRRSILSSRTSRAALPASDAPEWEVISPGVRLGYRRGRGSRGQGGSWLAASRSIEGKRLQERIGRADDVIAADGAKILTHEQAKDAARTWAKSLKTGGEQPEAVTVDVALDRYFAARAAEGMKAIKDARSRAAFHIRPKLGSIKVTDLTIEKVRAWRDGMVTGQKRLRTSKLAEKANIVTVDLSDPEVIRRRRDTANRTLTTLKAALNWAFNNRLVADDAAWRLVKPYRGTTAARVRFLSPDEQKKLIASSNGAIRDLVSAALVTGARFGELARLRVSDYDAANKSVFVAESKSGKPRHIPLPAGGADLFERLARDRSGG
ncbi:MAG: site-specific integrase, partial [Mesorhizobium sp.]